MSLFKSLNWFKSKKQEEIEQNLAATNLIITNLKEVNEQIFNLLKEKQEEKTAPEKVYKKIKMVDGLLTVVLHDGEILNKTNATVEDYHKAREVKSERELINMCYSPEGLEEKKKEEEQIAENKKIISGIEKLKRLSDFEFKEDSLYLKSANGVINRSIPELLVKRFIEIVQKYDFEEDVNSIKSEDLQNDVEYQSLKKFWLKCCLNPNARSAEDLYKFLKFHNMKIDRHGNFYTYRRVDKKEGTNKELVDFISNAYNKVKAVWKKNAANFWVHKTEEGFTFSTTGSRPDTIGNLKELYENLPNMSENGYTSRHTGKEDYKVGEVIAMPRYEGDDDNTINCSKGYHQASKAYDYSSFGDTPILAIVNPIDVLAVPLNEVGKLRVCRWFFAMTLPVEEQYILDDEDFDVTDLGDIFEEKCSIDLQNYVQNSIAEEVKRHTFTIPQVSASEIKTIVNSLEDMKKSISNRIVEMEDEDDEF